MEAWTAGEIMVLNAHVIGGDSDKPSLNSNYCCHTQGRDINKNSGLKLDS